MTDAERQRVLEEARSLIAKRPERYVPPPEPVRFRTFYDPPDEADEPEPAPEPFEPAPRYTAPDWSGWEAWVSARIGAAIAIERARAAELLAQVIAQTVAEEREAAAMTIRDQVRDVKTELTRVGTALAQLRDAVAVERSRVLDLPALPSCRDLN